MICISFKNQNSLWSVHAVALSYHLEGLMERFCPWRQAWIWTTKTTRRQQRSLGWLKQTILSRCQPSASTINHSSPKLSSPKTTTSRTTLINIARSVICSVCALYCMDVVILLSVFDLSWKKRCLVTPVWRTWRKVTSSSSRGGASTSVTSLMSHSGKEVETRICSVPKHLLGMYPFFCITVLLTGVVSAVPTAVRRVLVCSSTFQMATLRRCQQLDPRKRARLRLLTTQWVFSKGFAIIRLMVLYERHKVIWIT